MSTIRSGFRNLSLWFQWVLLSALGWFGLTLIANNLPQNLLGLLDARLPFVSFSLMAAVVAAIQWLLLRRHFAGGAKWVFAGAGGMWLAAMIAFPLKLEDIRLAGTEIYLDEIAFGFLFGLVLGSVQWLVVRTWLPRAWWWIASVTLGWGLGSLITQLIPLDWSRPYTGTIDAAIQLCMPIVLTGFTLMLLMRRKRAG